ncbi:aspartate ammonia-lyase [Corynebacterium pyruviciproducens]|uniref:Aspartate ammonia-lyase n=1 Tax=Corynebacterium pyruviciproducens TaxID=598660 RepID=A0AAF0YTT8_9CORY|nr:aspartate ammonia-lyase [Corynebacterium pyruviciproducens]MDH4658788.1 aspartate ammonia-lyase [Corynebacterium pyruviciproducens]MDK6567188.1 aspartate ammonia-lyase [Corynebacterium pyruviciproducens]WOT03317.1 aspartate ammonia-lyase [Corynebacterium pyruviciproducens]
MADNTSSTNNSTRTEEDLLGTMEISNDHYYGIHTQRAIDNYQISGVTVNSQPNFIRGMVYTKKATSIANNKVGALSKEKSDAINWACDRILNDGACMDQFPIDLFQGGAGTSLNMNTNEVVANVALEHLGKNKGDYDVIHPNDDVNMSQSTNDAYPTGLKLGFYAGVQSLVEELEKLIGSFDAKGKEFASVLKMGRTQLQDAVPMSLGQEFYGYAHTLGDEIDNLQRAAKELLVVNLGATAIGTELNTPDGFTEAVTKALAEVTGLDITSAPDLVAATSDQAAYVSVHAALRRLAIKLSKTCNDLRLLASGPRAGLKEINLPERAAGSSIMPAKVNPVIPEVVNQVCFKVFGNDVTVGYASEAGQLELNVMEPATGQAMFESLTILTNAMKTLREKCVDGITANPEICKNHVHSSIGVITYLNPFIGHAAGDRIGKEAAETGKSVRDLVLEHGLLDEETLDKVLSDENLINPSMDIAPQK